MKKNARASLALVTAACAMLAAVGPFGAPVARAFPLATPTPGPLASPAAAPKSVNGGKELPFDSSVIFVLDDAIASGASHAGETVRAHLKAPLVVGGVTVAPAGTPEKIRILDAESAKSGDVYGYVNIFFMPLALPDGRELPLRAPTSHLTANTSPGHEATVATEDTIGDIFIPYHVLYHAFRKGRNFTLGAGAEIRARTQATLTALRNGTVAIGTPQPISIDMDAPHSTFPVHQLATPKPNASPGPLQAPTLRPDRPVPGATPPA